MTVQESEKAVKIRSKVLRYFQPEAPPVELVSVLNSVQEEMKDVSEADIRDVILRLLVSHKLMYLPDMRITLGK